jgi:hypothetical protein
MLSTGHIKKKTMAKGKDFMIRRWIPGITRWRPNASAITHGDSGILVPWNKNWKFGSENFEKLRGNWEQNVRNSENVKVGHSEKQPPLKFEHEKCINTCGVSLVNHW